MRQSVTARRRFTMIRLSLMVLTILVVGYPRVVTAWVSVDRYEAAGTRRCSSFTLDISQNDSSSSCRPTLHQQSLSLLLQTRRPASMLLASLSPRQGNEDQNDMNEHEKQPLSRYTDSRKNDRMLPKWRHLDRRKLLQRAIFQAGATAAFASSNVAGAAESTSPFLIPTPPTTPDISWPLGKVAFSLLPLSGTYTRRVTMEECVIPDTIWTHDQIQGVVNVRVPVRQVVIKLSPQAGGGLWVHNPVAPTPQLLSMMKRLEQEHGPVRHIVLGTVALEHKATFGPFCQAFPKATVWIQPGQWSFPLSLPVDALGIVQKGRQLQELPVPGKPITNRYLQSTAALLKDSQPEWMHDIDYEVLGPFAFESVGGFSETAFFHKSTRSLLVTDTVISITNDPPPIIAEDPRALLFHARDNITDVLTEDTIELRCKGWRRMIQFGLVFFPSQITVEPSLTRALQQARKLDVSMRNLGEGEIPLSLYAWSWNAPNAEMESFDAISQNGALFCPPILTKLILDRQPRETLAWVDTVCQRFPSMQRIIPSHCNNDVRATAEEFSRAFDPLRSTPDNIVSQRALAQDLALLQKASDVLTKYRVVGPSLVCDGEPARVVGRFAD